MGIAGVAVLQCEVAASGNLRKCAALGEIPTDWGFKFAALRMAERGYMTATPSEGAPDGQVARLIVLFPKAPTDFHAP
jgi:hypothetical protein